MKKLFLIILIFILIIQISLAVCCNNEEGGDCYPDRNRCCGDPEEGYVGCKVANIDNPIEREDFDYFCPGELFPDCLQCPDFEECKPDGTGCEWDENFDTCEDEGGNCYVEYITGTKIPKTPASEYNICTIKCGEGQVWDEINQICVEGEEQDLTCLDEDCMSSKKCCKSPGKWEEGKGAVCSGDNDDDNICNYYDNCIDIINPKQEDTDEDCPDEKISFSEKCGDACDAQDEWCESAYTTRQCCNDEQETLGITTGQGEFYGYFNNDCPKETGTTLGCWSSCIGEYNGQQVTYEVGPCIDGEKTIKVFKDGTLIETKKEPCSGIPLIPFFTNFNLLASFLILFLFYFFKER